MPPLRPELEPLPSRLQTLKVDKRGYPVPWFVAWENGEPEFRAADASKRVRAVTERRCWVCGDLLGRYLVFVVGPMCGINRTTSEPACHLECAEWSARNCPFLVRPQMVRREDDTIDNARLIAESHGTAIPRNPGVTLLWTTKEFKVFYTGKDKNWLITMGDPIRVQWYARGRIATREEIVASIDSGLPALREIARQQVGAEAVLDKMHAEFLVRHALMAQAAPV